MKRPLLRPSYLLHGLTVFITAALVHGAEPAPVTLYDKDPLHLWNRLYTALMMPEKEGKAFPPDLLDPASRELLLARESARNTAVALLREFVQSGPRPETMSPLQRAVMQRDLLAVFHLIAHRDGPGGAWAGPRKELLVSLAEAIRRVAMSAEDIKKLPDNYAAATAAPDAVTTYDPARPGAFLPKDLLTENGPWVALMLKESTRDPVASFHFEMFRGRTFFEVRLRHPEGRAAGEAYLKALADMKNSLLPEKPEGGERLAPNGVGGGLWPNPETPQFPAGTMWALVRHPLLVDAKGQLVVAPLVESVQIRVYNTLSEQAARESPAYRAEIDALREKNQKFDFDKIWPKYYQTFFEWEMQRSLMLGKGGFHLTTAEDLKYSHFAPVEGTGPVSSFCIQCHAAPGIHSVQSRAGLFRDPVPRSPELAPASREMLDLTAVTAAKKCPAWVLLEWLWQEPQVR